MYLVYTPDGIRLVSGYYITCLNLLFSNRQGRIYISKRRLLGMRTDARTVPPAKDVEHVGNVLDRGRSVQLTAGNEATVKRCRR